jgi:hypothetical protein
VNLNEVVTNQVSENGVQPITAGAVIFAQVRDGLRSVLKHHDEEGYAQYRAIKYPTGEGSDTAEARLAATRFLFDRVRDILLPHYVSTKGMNKGCPGCESCESEGD